MALQALDHGQPVAFASSYVDADVIDLCNLGVAESHRRRGIGRALVAARLADAAQRGATTVVSTPSPEGWRLQQALGFRSVRSSLTRGSTYRADGVGRAFCKSRPRTIGRGGRVDIAQADRRTWL